MEKEHRLKEIKTIKGQNTYRRMMEAAAKCVATLGIENTSVTTIAKKAGISRGLVAHYLPRQADLLLVIMVHIGRVGTETVTRHPDDATGEEKLLFSIKSNFSFFETYPHYFSCQLLLFSSSAVREDCRKLNRALYAAFVSRMVGYLRLSAKEKNLKIPEKKLHEFAEFVYASLDGALIIHFFMLDHKERGAYQKRHMERLRKELCLFFSRSDNN